LSTNGGVSRFDGHAFTSFGREHGLSSAQVWSLFEARDGTIWAGTAAGPCRLDGKRFVALELPRFPEGGAPRAVWCLAQDREGALWFGTDQGICIQRPAGFGFVTTSNALGHDSATSIAFAADGATWCGSMSSGLSRSDERSVVCFRAPEDIGGNEVWSVALDQRGAAWFTCEGHGVYRCEGATLSNFSTAQGLDVLAPQSIHQDRAGRIWVGGGGGLYRLEGERFVHVQRNGPWR
jgi:ligand-binding sensor domain-containing protein